MQLSIKPYRPLYLDDFSCGASCLRALAKYHLKLPISHEEAVELTNCRPNGCSFEEMIRALKQIGLVGKKIKRTQSNIKKSICAGNPVLSNDNYTHMPDDHFIILTGLTSCFYRLIDPNYDFTFKRRKDLYFKYSEDIAVSVEKKI